MFYFFYLHRLLLLIIFLWDSLKLKHIVIKILSYWMFINHFKVWTTIYLKIVVQIIKWNYLGYPIIIIWRTINFIVPPNSYLSVRSTSSKHDTELLINLAYCIYAATVWLASRNEKLCRALKLLIFHFPYFDDSVFAARVHHFLIMICLKGVYPISMRRQHS